MLEIGSLVDGKYKILNKIGQGGMSVVYLAMNERANKQWAIKEVRKDGVSNFEVVKQGLVAEIDMLKRLNHPHLPSIIDVIDTDGSFLIVMDYIEGVSLDKKIKEAGPLPEEDVIEWGKQLADVLGYLHTRDKPIIYRDMKPANVMLKPDGNVMLIDFGTAREFKSTSVADTVCLGTQGYAAPEQFGGHGQTDARTDVYCLGATLYHLVTGHDPSQPPFEMYPIRQWNPALSGGLEAIILKCTRKNPDERYQSCAELLYALEHAKDVDPLVIRNRNRKWRAFIAVTVAAVLCFGTSGVFKYKSVRDNEWEYTNLIDNAKSYTEFDDLQRAAELFPKRYKPYERVIDIIEEDENFTEEENVALKETFLNQTFIDKTRFKSEKEYKRFAYEMGLAYLFYYEPAGNSGIAMSKSWFEEASGAQPFDSEFGLTQEDINNAAFLKNLTEAIVKGVGSRNKKTSKIEYSYAQYFKDLISILDVESFDEAYIATKRWVYSRIHEVMIAHTGEVLSEDVNESLLESTRQRALTDLKAILKGIDESKDKALYDEINNLIKQFETVDSAWTNSAVSD